MKKCAATDGSVIDHNAEPGTFIEGTTTQELDSIGKGPQSVCTWAERTAAGGSAECDASSTDSDVLVTDIVWLRELSNWLPQFGTLAN